MVSTHEYAPKVKRRRFARGTSHVVGIVEETLEGRWHGEARVATGTHTCEGETPEEAMAIVDGILARTLTSKKISAWTSTEGLWHRMGEGLLGPVPVVEVRPAKPSEYTEAPYTVEYLDGGTLTYSTLWRAKGHADYTLRACGYVPESSPMGEGWHPGLDEVEEQIREERIKTECAVAERMYRRDYPTLKGPEVELDDGTKINLDRWSDHNFTATITDVEVDLDPARTFIRDDKTFHMIAKGKFRHEAFVYLFLREDVEEIPWYAQQTIESYQLTVLPRPAPPETLPEAPSAPKTLGPWVNEGEVWKRYAPGATMPTCFVFAQPQGEEAITFTVHVLGDTIGGYPTLGLATDYCNTALIKAGYTLQD